MIKYVFTTLFISAFAYGDRNYAALQKQYCCTDSVLRTALYMPTIKDAECSNVYFDDVLLLRAKQLFLELELEGNTLLTSVTQACVLAFNAKEEENQEGTESGSGSIETTYFDVQWPTDDAYYWTQYKEDETTAEKIFYHFF